MMATQQEEGRYTFSAVVKTQGAEQDDALNADQSSKGWHELIAPYIPLYGVNQKWARPPNMQISRLETQVTFENTFTNYI